MSNSIRLAPSILDPKDLIIRHLIILMMSLFFGSLNTLTTGFEFFTLEWTRNVGFNFLYIATIWNGNIALVSYLDSRINWEHEIKKFIWLLITIAIALPIAAHYLFNLVVFPLIHGHPCAINSRENIIFLIISVTITLLVNSIFAAVGFFSFWRTSIKEQEELKREGLSAEFETLKSQINPHFLFNSLNTLTSLIEENPKTATDFVQKLASVYRYVLTQKDKELVTLKDELQFVESYIYLNQIRFGKNLQTIVNIDASYLDKKIVTLSLQMLIENAIKHNVISSLKPLTIEIGIENDKVFLSNNLQRKQVMNESNGIGLNNIVHRYSLLSQSVVEIMDNDIIFKVSLPLL